MQIAKARKAVAFVLKEITVDPAPKSMSQVIAVLQACLQGPDSYKSYPNAMARGLKGKLPGYCLKLVSLTTLSASCVKHHSSDQYRRALFPVMREDKGGSTVRFTSRFPRSLLLWCAELVRNSPADFG